jgi:glycerol-3-phosphate acyltransferase PlsY
VLDAAKGAAAPALALWALGAHGWGLLPVALAPSLGHATSPWLRGRGGKAITTTFGVWAALSTWVVPTLFGLSLAGLMLVQSVSAWTVVLAGALTVVALILLQLDAPLVVAFLCSLLLLVWTHRRELRTPPRFGLRARRGA